MPLINRCIFVFLLLLVGCFRRPDPFVPFGEILTQDEIMKVTSRVFGNKISTYRALFSCTFSYGRKNYGFRQAIVLDNKKRVRLETFPEGALYSIALYQNDGTRGVLTLQDDKEARILPATQISMNKDLSLHLRPEDLLPLFSSSNFVSEYSNVKGFREGDNVTLTEGNGKKQWDINGKNLSRFISRDENEKKDLIFSIDTLTYEDNFLLPVQLSIELPEKDILLSCKRIRIEVNSELKEQLFTPSVPDTWKVTNEGVGQ